MTEKLSHTRYVLGSAEGELVRFSHLHVHTKRLNKQSKAEEYGVQILIPKTATKTIAEVKAAIDQQIAQFFPGGKGKGPQFWYPLRDGDKDVKQNGDPLGAECKGHFVLNAKNQEDVGVVGTEQGADKKPKSLFFIEDAGAPNGVRRRTLAEFGKVCKSGDFGRVSVNIKGYTKGTGGVAAYLNGLQKVQDGEALAAGMDASDEFAAYGGGSEGVLD
jgi:hypothetical protein